MSLRFVKYIYNLFLILTFWEKDFLIYIYIVQQAYKVRFIVAFNKNFVTLACFSSSDTHKLDGFFLFQLNWRDVV
jgi:hypothetical protein